jgi:hypothetical protein
MVMKDMDWLGSLKKLWSCQSERKWHQAQSPRLKHDYTLWAGQKDAEQGRWVICPLCAWWELLMMSSSITCLLLLWAIAKCYENETWALACKTGKLPCISP